MGRNYRAKLGHGGFTAESGYSVSGTFTDGASITIAKPAGGFGSGPTLVLYDDGSGGSAGVEATASSPVVGTYSVPFSGRAAPKYQSGARDGGMGLQVLVPGDASFKQVTYLHSDNFSEFFLSFVLITKNGYAGGVEPGTLGTGSNWKQSWMFSGTGDDSYGQTDCCWGSHNGTGSYIIGGNEPGVIYPGVGSNNAARFDFYGPNVFQFYGKNDTATANGSGPWWMAYCSSKYYGENGGTSSAPWSGSPGTYRRALLPGYFGSPPDFIFTNADWLYCDIYLAVGQNAAKRLLVTDAASLAASTQIYLCRPTGWADDSITALLPNLATGQSWDGKYLHWVSADNVPTLVGSFS